MGSGAIDSAGLTGRLQGKAFHGGLFGLLDGRAVLARNHQLRTRLSPLYESRVNRPGFPASRIHIHAQAEPRLRALGLFPHHGSSQVPCHHGKLVPLLIEQNCDK